MKYLVVASLSFLPAVALAQTPPNPPALTAQQQLIGRVNGDRDSVETALRHYEESVVLNDQSRQAEIAALTEQVTWWKDCNKTPSCRAWLLLSNAPTAEAK